MKTKLIGILSLATITATALLLCFLKSKKPEKASPVSLSSDEGPASGGFRISTIDDELFSKMQDKSYKADCIIPRDDLRHVRVLHIGFDDQTKEGELVCHKCIADDLLEIFQKLHAASYQIEKIRLVDEYDADDERVMQDNNSSCFNYRLISYTTQLSKHALGVAVDINTLYNPYLKYVNGQRDLEPITAEPYVDRTRDFPHKIDENDLCLKLFKEHGFDWGGDWTDSLDYQHFELSDDQMKKRGLMYPLSV